MTIPKRDKVRKGGISPLPPPIEDKMVRKYPRACPYCGMETFSTFCKCGRFTVLKINLE